MQATKLEEEFASIVLVGSFNPAIFHPAWLASKGLIRPTEAEGAQVDVVHPDLASFRVGPFHVSVTREKFTGLTTDPSSFAPLRDLVAGIFELLEHTPTSRLGINRAMHLRLANTESWHALGDMLAPKAPWERLLAKPGLRSLLLQSPRKDELSGQTYVRVEPSQKFSTSAFVDINNEIHGSSKESSMTSDATAIIRRDFDRLMREAFAIPEQILGAVQTP